MTPQIATLLFAVGIAGLFALDRDRVARPSKAVWLPVIWIWISGSRMVSEWTYALFRFPAKIDQRQVLAEGSPIDRVVLTGLVAVGVLVLLHRNRQVGSVLQANLPVILFFSYCTLSVLWSDYSDVAFKRLIKGFGDLIMVLILLTDAEPQAAVKRLLARISYVLIPLSLLTSKYYPEIGRAWSRWGGASYQGIATSKNELGGICLLCGLGALWRLCLALRRNKNDHAAGPLIVQGTLLAMVICLFWMSNTVTAISCFLMGSILIVATNFRTLQHGSWVTHLIVTAMLCISASVLFLGTGSGVVQTMGRDPTLTGRTELWSNLLSVKGNSILGTGFESFWLGPRLDQIWNIYWWQPNEAHNGYVEVFLNLGWAGITLLAVLMIVGYRHVIEAFRFDPEAGPLRLAYFVMAVAYNFTESAIRIMHPVWIFFLLATIAVPGGWRRKSERHVLARQTLNLQPALCAEVSTVTSVQLADCSLKRSYPRLTFRRSRM